MSKINGITYGTYPSIRPKKMLIKVYVKIVIYVKANLIN